MSGTEHIDRLYKWHSWYKHNLCKTLVENVHWCKGKGVLSNNIPASLHSEPVQNLGDDEVKKAKRSIQQAAMQVIIERGSGSARYRTN